MIELEQTLLIGEGGDRVCYLHPEDHTKCIKVTKHNKSSHKNTLLELKAYRTLQRRNIKPAYIASYFGTTQTTSGVGYIFEYIDTRSRRIEHLPPEELKDKIFDLYEKCLNDSVVLRDLSIDNITVGSDGNIRIIDGLGARELIPICYWSRYFARQKLKRKFDSFIKKLEKRTKGWTRPLTGCN